MLESASMSRGQHAHAVLWGEPERRRLVRLCAAITRDRDAAEDLAQETLVEAWRNAHKVHDPDGVDRWLASIARNVCRRWARRRGRDAAVAAAVAAESAPADLEVELERAELVELVDRALALLPPATRDVLVHRYVHDLPHAETAARLGISPDAVSMRLSRGKVVLRQVLAADVGDEAPDGWAETRVWCTQCGGRRLEMRREPQALSFRCRGCNDQASTVFDLTNPFFARLVGDLVRPAPILTRAAEWSGAYFTSGAGEVDCVGCGARIALERHDGRRSAGLAGTCRACGHQVWSSAHGIAQALPEVRALRREHPRARMTREWQVEHGGADASVIRFQAPTSSAAVDVVLAADTLRVLKTA
jgi:RNA polymerase sigma factor (sigma-70 family)